MILCILGDIEKNEVEVKVDGKCCNFWWTSSIEKIVNDLKEKVNKIYKVLIKE